MDESSLSPLVRYHDRDAFTHLYDSYSPAIFGEIMRMVKNRECAEHLLHDVFMDIWHNGHEYDSSKGRLFTWMLLITRSRCNEHLQKTDGSYR